MCCFGELAVLLWVCLLLVWTVFVDFGYLSSFVCYSCCLLGGLVVSVLITLSLRELVFCLCLGFDLVVVVVWLLLMWVGVYFAANDFNWACLVV